MISNRDQFKNALISIILPTYNGEKYIRETIESALKQTYPNYELIIIDDGSGDNTPEIIREYSNNSNVKTYINRENFGQAENWNSGIKKASGKFIKFLGQDDVLMPNYLEEATSVLMSHKSVSLVCSFEKSIGKIDKIRGLNIIPAFGELSGFQVQRHILRNGNWIGGPTAVMFRKEILKEIGLFNSQLKCSLDFDLWLRILSKGNLYVIPKVLYSCRVHENQESNNCFKKLGFLKDKIRILHNIQNQENKYGNLSKIIESDIDKSHARKFIINAANSDFLFLKDTIHFLNKYYSHFFLLKAAILYVMFFVYKKIKLFLKFGDKKDKNSSLTENYLKESEQKIKEINLFKDVFALTWTRSGAVIKKLEDTPHYDWIKKRIDGKKEINGENSLSDYIKIFYPDSDIADFEKKTDLFFHKWETGNKNFSESGDFFLKPSVIINENNQPVLITGIEFAAYRLLKGKKSLRCTQSKYDVQSLKSILSTDRREKLLI